MDSVHHSAVEVASAAMVVDSPGWVLFEVSSPMVVLLGAEHTEGVHLVHPWADVLSQTYDFSDESHRASRNISRIDRSLDNTSSGSVHHGSHGRHSCHKLCHGA